MISTLFLALSASLSFLCINALILEKRENPAVFSLPFERRKPAQHHLQRRSGEVTVPIANHFGEGGYLVPVQIGTPPQTTYVQLDTGSNYLIVETPKSNLCQSDPTICTRNGASLQLMYIDSDMSVQYGGGDGTTGDDAFDVLSIGGAKISKYRFGIQYETTVGSGVFGVGLLPANYPGFQGTPQTGHFPSALVANGIIASKAFSLWLNDDRSTSGQVLFGGVDTKKFKGNLATINCVPDQAGEAISSFVVPLLNLTLTDEQGKVNTLTGGASPGVGNFDSGTTSLSLPTALADSIFKALGATFSNPFVQCSIADTPTTLNFAFEGKIIHAPISQFLGNNQNGECQLLIFPTDGAVFFFGDQLLTSMYIVYDIDNKQVSIAETVFNATSSNVLQIMAGPNGVPKDPGVGGTTVSASKTTTTTTTKAPPTTTPYITDTIGYPIRKPTTFTSKPYKPYTVGIVVVVTPSPYPPPGRTASKPYYITNTLGYPISKPTRYTFKPTSTYSVGVVVVITPSPYPAKPK